MAVTVSYLIVAGGGATENSVYAGGGGGGGVLAGSDAITSGSFPVVVGAGGVGGATPTAGANSSYNGHTATGGGPGNDSANNDGFPAGGAGGCGGGARGSGASVTGGTGSQGGNGGNNLNVSPFPTGGGGGAAPANGADGSGSQCGAGGAGYSSAISGATLTYAGGGGSGQTGSGLTLGAAGACTSGYGGGGTASGTIAGQAGVVIVSYPTGAFSGYTVTGGTITTSGGNTIHTFTANGTFAIVAPPPFFPPDFPNPTLRIRPSDRFGFSTPLNLPQIFYVPPRPTYLTEWPNPVRRKNAPAWQQSLTQSLCIPRDADYFYAYVWVTVDGIPRVQGRSASAGSIDYDSLTITDVIDETPNTCQFTARGFTPRVGMEVVVTLGSATRPNPERLFAGTILQAKQLYLSAVDQPYVVSCIDWTWQLNRRKVVKQYTGWTATAIAIDLITTYAPGFTVNHVAALDVVDQISFTNVDLTAALTQLAKRVGAYWSVDYLKDLHLFTSESASQPLPISSTNRPMTFSVDRDLGQWITRALSEGGGGNAATAVAVGETILPLDDATWYELLGGTVTTGSQRLTYTGRALGGGGSLVGPGASPSAAPVLALAAGAGVDSGAHNYAATFVTASGESIASPISTITTGPVSAPVSAPIAGAPTLGTGPNPGSHDYAVTFVTATGETTASPTVTKATSLTTAPGAAPTAGAPTSGGSVDVGSHDYEVTFVTSIGETTPSPVSGAATTASSSLADPSVAPTEQSTSAGNVDVGFHDYAYTFYNAAGETLPSPHDTALASPSPKAFTYTITTGPSGTVGRKVYRTTAGGSQLKLVTTVADNSTTTVVDNLADSGLGANAPSSNTTASSTQTVPLSNLPLSSETINGRNIYRRFNGAGTFKLVAYIGDNSTTTYSDTTANASLGAAAPSSSTAYLQRIPLSAIPTGSAVVTSRKIYRTSAGGSQLKLVTTIADNTTTTYTDTVTDASLGANVPTSNTATANQVALSSIPTGVAAVTSRKIYRTAAAGSQLKLVTTIGDNTTTTYTDSTADASLGANVPTSDTSGLTQPNGQVAAGSATLIVAGSGAFPSAGWAIIGNGQQAIRYTGTTGAALTGIPTSGPGAIVASIGYNSTVTACPQLTGIPASGAGSIVYAIASGDAVNLLAQADDTDGQAALSAILDPANLLGGAAGIVEDYVRDGRISHTEALARAEARLAQRNAIDERLSYSNRDPLTASRKTIQVIDYPPPATGTSEYQIQHVTITTFRPSLANFPTYTVEAATSMNSFEALLRQVIAQGGA